MEYAEFIQQAPLARPWQFNAAEEIEAAMSCVGLSDFDLRPLGEGPFRTDWAVVEAGDDTLFSGRYNNGFSLHLQPPTNQIGILMCSSESGRLLASGKNVSDSRLLFLPEAFGTDIVAPPLSGSETICIQADRFRELVCALAPGSTAFDHATVMTGSRHRLDLLRREVMALMANPSLNESDECLAGLLTEIILWIDSSAPPDRVNSARNHVRIAKTARDYIEANYREAFRMEDLCRESGHGARLLQRCFREYFDLTITEYLKTRRLSAAHRALRAGRSDQTSVARVAHANGFAHLGRFSVEFHQRFGQTPSDVLRVD